MKEDRFLLAIMIGIVVLSLAGVGLYIVRSAPPAMADDSTPEGVIQNYSIALDQGDYDTAYAYLSEGNYKPRLNDFREVFENNQLNPSEASIQIRAVEVDEKEAHVTLELVHSGSGLFADTWRETATAELVQQQGKWKLLNMPHPYWNWDWYQQPPEEFKNQTIE
jgi:hypothetical protein